MTLRTKPDDILEGEERFTLSLVAADNNADISPIEGDATIVILADKGASGVISIKPDSRFVLVGEPSEDYTGKAEVNLMRSGGIFGEVKVTWQIVRRDLSAFVQTQGEVLFENEQPITAILIQVRAESEPFCNDQWLKLSGQLREAGQICRLGYQSKPVNWPYLKGGCF